jgi:GPH family glycoside/pentoside/hexuronide:cation symporter
MMIYLASYFGSGFLFMPFWIWFARRFGKKTAYLVTFIPGMLASFSLFLMGEGDLWLCEVVLIFAGSVFGARLFLAPALQADVIDYDELHTGKRREAQYGALWAFVSKFTVILSMSVPLAVLASLGYVPNQPQSDQVTFAIRAIIGLAPAASALLAFGVAWLYPITEEVHRRVWQGIEAHRRGEDAVDPVTGEGVQPPSMRGVDEETGWFLDHFSKRELERVIRTGAPALSVRLGAWVAMATLAFLVCVGETVATFGDGSADPGIVATLWVLGGGLSLGLLAFHAVRLRAARRLGRSPIPVDLMRAHLSSG